MRCLAVVVCALALAQAGEAGRLAPSLQETVAAAGDGEMLDVIVLMARAPESALAGCPPREVGARLRELSGRSQRGLLADLNDLQARGEVRRVRRLAIVNGLALAATRRAVVELARRPDVGRVCADPVLWVPPLVAEGRHALANGVEWNIAAVKADQAWADTGLRGEGTVIALIDTGADVSHPALAANYRGGGNSWFDAINGRVRPYDDHGHGTATTGLACGNDPAERYFGVAPRAQFVLAKAFAANGGGRGSELIACGEFMLDPDGDPATADMPDVVSNSWAGGFRDPWYQSVIDAWEAAGIYPVFAAGNQGPSAGSVESPGDYPGAMGVGATTTINLIAPFSGRGPAAWPGQVVLKPNLVAPGSGVRALRFGGGYIPSVAGTSFSCPHVSGAAALVRQTDPLIDSASLTSLLESTAVDLGDPGPDNSYGHGMLDVHATLAAHTGGAPQLRFVGIPGYEADGVEPEFGDAATPFVWTVVYTDPDNEPPAGGVRLHVLAAGIPIPGSPFTMADEGPADFTTGRVYSATRQLSRGEEYSYRFEASDGRLPARGEGSVLRYGPAVRNAAPVLSWIGTTKYGTDGVDPDVGSPWHDRFWFGVRYADADGDPPAAIRVRIERGGTVARVLDLHTPRAHPDYRRGAAFYATTKLGPGVYRYRFYAHDGTVSAVGSPRDWTPGPELYAPPRLDWVGAPGYETDGVEPDSGQAYLTRFDFRVKVSDTQGQAPGRVRLQLCRDNRYCLSVDMAPKRTHGPSELVGRTYWVRTKLPPGQYRYRFAAEDADGQAVGPATRWQPGLKAHRAVAAARAVTTVTVTPAGQGAEIALSLATDASISCRVLNVAGRLVRTFCIDRACSAGLVRLFWDGRDGSGLPVPEGPYLVQVTTRGETGETAQVVRPVAVRRR